jgi:PhzF family phenazine biosynthesis protein
MNGNDSGPIEVLRYAAFTVDGTGGNPAGVVLDANGVEAAAMLEIAAAVGFSETIFLSDRIVDAGGRTLMTTRYFSPLAEVAFCGHATVAAAVALAERGAEGTLVFRTNVGDIEVRTTASPSGPMATLTSVAPYVVTPDRDDVAEALAALDWHREDLDSRYPVQVAFAGNEHLVLVTSSAARLSALDYDVPRLTALMTARAWTTIALIHALTPTEFLARNPFPVGGVFEDPATGAAAAAFGGYLRALALVRAPVRVVIRQGEDMGRPSRLLVDIPEGDGGIHVSGAATRMTTRGS